MTRECFRSGWGVILLTGLVFESPSVRAEESWQHEYDEAVAAARNEGKDILIDFSGTDWCGPCKRLWDRTLSQPEFIRQASTRFVLLDIDNLVREPMPEGRKERYEALQERFGIHAFPTVVLATAEGRPYASTGLLEEINNPAAYWKHLEPLYERGQRFKAALNAANGDQTPTSAESIVAALSELRPDFVVKFYPGALKRLREITPSDDTDYLGFIAGRSALLELESKLHEGFISTYVKWQADEAIDSRWVKALSPSDVDAIIRNFHLHGASLREAFLARLFLEIDAGDWSRGLDTVERIANIDAPPSRFEKSNFVHFSVRSREKLREHVEAARHAPNALAQLRELYGIVKNDFECVTPTSCCNHSFTLQLHTLLAGAAYGRMLLESTARLEGESRAAAIGKGLEGIELWANGSIGRIVCDLMPKLAGKEAAMKYLPPRYADWLRD